MKLENISGAKLLQHIHSPLFNYPKKRERNKKRETDRIKNTFDLSLKSLFKIFFTHINILQFMCTIKIYEEAYVSLHIKHPLLFNTNWDLDHFWLAP
jgi:hypothetical protein